MKKSTLKRTLVSLLTFALVMNVFAAGEPSKVSGTGTEADPYLIGSVADLQEIGKGGTDADFKGKYYKFIADIDFEGADQLTLWHNGGFVGHIDGNGFVIKNVRISGQGWLQSHLGMFWQFQGTMKNLGFKNITLNGAINPWATDGIKAAADQGIITNGLLPDSKIEFCWADSCKIVGTAGNYAGGLVGAVKDTVSTTITNCFANVEITGEALSGGIAGINGGTISKTAFYGTLPAGAHSIAKLSAVGTVADSYYSATADTITTGSTAVAAADLTKETSFPAFDFVARPGWEMGAAYPMIKLTSLVVSNVAYENVGTKNNAKNAATYSNETGLMIYPPMDSANYVFEGWYRDAALSDMVKDSVAILADPTSVGDVTFYAKWVELKEYNLVFENLGDADANNAAIFQNDTAVTLNAVTDFKGGDSLFIGWYTDAAMTMPIKTPAITVGAEADQTFYAKWVYRPFIAGGNGSDSLPYLVSTVYDMQNFALVPGWSYFKLINDIDMEGEDFTPFKNLSGGFDGGDHVIKNLHIAAGNNSGFAKQLSGYIKNLGLEGVSVDGGQGSGALVGAMWNGTEEKPITIENCYVLGDTIKGSGAGVGGLVGYCWTLNNIIKDVYVAAHVVGTNEVGGLFGRTSLKDATNLSNGAFYGTIETAGAASGAIMGLRHGSSIADQTLPNSFYFSQEYLYGLNQPIDQASTTNQEGAVGLDWDALAEESSYATFDFTNTWKIVMIDEDSEMTCAVLKFNPTTALRSVEKVSMTVYPNPSEGAFNFNLESKAEVMVSDLSGKLVVNKIANAGQQTLDLSSYGAGIYILRVKEGNTTAISKLVVR